MGPGPNDVDLPMGTGDGRGESSGKIFQFNLISKDRFIFRWDKLGE